MAKKKSETQIQTEAPAPDLVPTPDPAPTIPPGDLSASDVNGTADQPEAPANGGGQKPVRVFSYLVQRDTYVQASVWEKVVTMRDNTTFTTHEVSVRKRYKNGGGEWATSHSFRGSELYALAHAVERAEAFILDLRAGETPF